MSCKSASAQNSKYIIMDTKEALKNYKSGDIGLIQLAIEEYPELINEDVAMKYDFSFEQNLITADSSFYMDSINESLFILSLLSPDLAKVINLERAFEQFKKLNWVDDKIDWEDINQIKYCVTKDKDGNLGVFERIFIEDGFPFLNLKLASVFRYRYKNLLK